MSLELMAAMAAAGMAKNEFIDKPRQDKQNRINAEMAAAQTENAPLSNKIGAGSFMPQLPTSGFDTAMQFGLAGAGLAQQKEKLDMMKKLNDERMGAFQTIANGGRPGSFQPAPVAFNMLGHQGRYGNFS